MLAPYVASPRPILNGSRNSGGDAKIGPGRTAAGVTGMRRIVVGIFAAIGILAVLIVAGIGVVVWRLAPAPAALPEAMILQADLNRGLAAGAGQDALSDIVFGTKPNLRDFIDALDRAGGDPRVKGLFLDLGDDTLALATCQEVRDAIRAFRAKGKFAIAFATSFGEFGPGSRPYYLATAADEIWLQPLALSVSSAWRSKRRSCAARSTSSASRRASSIASNSRPQPMSPPKPR